MKRKEFIVKSGSAVLGTALLSQLVSCGDNDVDELNRQISIDLDDEEFALLDTEGNWKLHPDENVLLVNVNGDIRAFSSVCPHAQCSRDWAYRPGVFTCTCHVSRFDTTGQYLSGPANANLREFPVSSNGRILTVG
jgi:Rieske Fe-S protein